MLNREDYIDGTNLSEAQRGYKEQMMRPGVKRLRGRPRGLLSMTLVPKKLSDAGGDYWAPDLRTPVVQSKYVEFVKLGDRSVSSGRTGSRSAPSEILATISSLHSFQAGGTPTIGGSASATKLRIDFAKPPLMPGQSGLSCRSQGDLKSPFAGKFTLQRVGDRVDLCVGSYNRSGRHSFPRIVYRLPVSLFTSGIAVFPNPEWKVPDAGATCDLVKVEVGTSLVNLTRVSEYETAQFDDRGEPMFTKPGGRVLLATKLDYLQALTAMYAQQNDILLSRAGLDETPPAEPAGPHAWNLRTMLEVRVPRMSVAQTETPTFQPSNLLSIPGWRVTPALETDFLAAIGPEGNFKLRAKVTGKVQQVAYLAEQPHLVKLIFDNGGEQVIPACAPVSFEIEGTSFKYGDVLCDPCHRVECHTMARAEELFEGNVDWMLREFLFQTAIESPNSSNQGALLYPFEYIPDELIVPGIVDHQNREPVVYIDLRSVQQYYVPQTGAIVLPPIVHPATCESFYLNRILVCTVETDAPARDVAEHGRESSIASSVHDESRRQAQVVKVAA